MRLKLIVRPDGRALLTTTESISVNATERLREMFDELEPGKSGLAIIPECDVIQVSEIDVDLGPADPPKPASEAQT